jgi:hypothetical protein
MHARLDLQSEVKPQQYRNQVGVVSMDEVNVNERNEVNTSLIVAVAIADPLAALK